MFYFFSNSDQHINICKETTKVMIYQEYSITFQFFDENEAFGDKIFACVPIDGQELISKSIPVVLNER